MASVLAPRSDALVKEFSALSDWEARYRALIELGKKLPEMPESLKNEGNKVKGCQSQVWLHAELTPQGRVVFQADSDALIVKGLIAVLLQVYSDAPPSEILHFPPIFLKELGFEGNLSPSRANGLHAMLQQIRNYAIAYHYVLNNKK